MDLQKRNWYICFVVCFLLICSLTIPLWNQKKILYQKLQSADVTGYLNYTVNMNDFVITGDDPQFYLQGDFSGLTSVQVVFSNRVKEETDIQLFWAKKGEEFSAQNMVEVKVRVGESKANIDFPTGNYSRVRFDIDKNFVLDHIRMKMINKKINGVRVIVFVLFSLIVSFVIAFGHKYIIELFQKCKKKWQIQHFFLVAGLFLGIIFSFLVPPAQVPDEHTHYSLIEQEFGYTGFYEEIYQFYLDTHSEGMQGNSYIKQDIIRLKEHLHDHFDYSTKQLGKPNIYIVRHFPMGLGFYLGVILHLPIYYCLQLAELFAVIFYLIIGYLTLKHVPIIKPLFCATLLLPMMVHQCSSNCYDAVLLPICFLTIALILEMIYTEVKLTWKKFFLICGLLIIIFLIKMPYDILALLLFLIPGKNWQLKLFRRWDLYRILFWRKWVLPVALLCFIGLAFVVLKNSNMYIRLLIASLLVPKDTARVMFMTLKQLGAWYSAGTVAIFGYLDTNAPTWFYIFVFVCCFLFSQRVKNGKNEIHIGHRIMFGGVSLVIIYMVILSMITWTMYLEGIEYQTYGIKGYMDYIRTMGISLGVQGRYFLPVFPLLYLAVAKICRLPSKLITLVQIIYYMLVVYVSFEMLLSRFWGVL